MTTMQERLVRAKAALAEFDSSPERLALIAAVEAARYVQCCVEGCEVTLPRSRFAEPFWYSDPAAELQHREGGAPPGWAINECYTGGGSHLYGYRCPAHHSEEFVVLANCGGCR